MLSKGVLLPPKIIWTATIGKVFCQAGRVRFFRVAARTVITKAFSRGLGRADINEVAGLQGREGSPDTGPRGSSLGGGGVGPGGGGFEHLTCLALSVVPDMGFLSPTDRLVEAGQAAVAVALRRWFL